jgi:putative nucleotidyltransferase with HDIG domain
MPTLVSKFVLRPKLVASLQEEAEIPAFSQMARKLMEIVNDPKADIDSIAEVAMLDPGITAKYLRLASSPSFSGKYITSIKDALMVIGLNEAQRLAMTIVVLGRFSVLKVKIDWELFWLHCLLTARLTEYICGRFREPDGREYLAGLLHDIGKLYLGHHFPKEFERSVVHAMTHGTGLYQAERELFDITHADVAQILTKKWNLQPDLIAAVAHHHDVSVVKDESCRFLAGSLYLADKLANMTRANIQGAECMDRLEFEDLPEWEQLKAINPSVKASLDLPAELKKAKDIISSVKEPTLVR